MRALTQKQVDQFWLNVRRGSPGDCWEWLGGCNHGGYGQLRLNGKHVRTHQVAFFLAVGVWPSQVVIRHSCDNKKCCNPAHLLDGTFAENNQDSIERGQRKPIPPAQIGEKNSHAALSEQEVLRIRELGLLMAPGDIAKLAEFKGRLNRKMCWRILCRETWDHL